MKQILAVASVLSVLAGAAFAQAAPKLARLRVVVDLTQYGHGSTTKNHELFVTRAGDVTIYAVTYKSHVSHENQWLARQASSTASASEMRGLDTLLSAAHIGLGAEKCSAIDDILGARGTYDITWYGRGARRSQVVVELNGASPGCPTEMLQLVNGINAFANSFGQFDFGRSVPVW